MSQRWGFVTVACLPVIDMVKNSVIGVVQAIYDACSDEGNCVLVVTHSLDRPFNEAYATGLSSHSRCLRYDIFCITCALTCSSDQYRGGPATLKSSEHIQKIILFSLIIC